MNIPVNMPYLPSVSCYAQRRPLSRCEALPGHERQRGAEPRGGAEAGRAGPGGVYEVGAWWHCLHAGRRRDDHLGCQPHLSLEEGHGETALGRNPILLYHTIPYYTIHTIRYDTTLHYTTLYYTILCYTMLYYTILYYTILYILYYIFTILFERFTPILNPCVGVRLARLRFPKTWKSSEVAGRKLFRNSET